MFSILITKILTEDIPDLSLAWKEIREFSSPNGKMKIIFHHPFEFANGALEWQVTLVDNGRDVTTDHPFLSKKMGCCQYGQPWSCDSEKILFTKRMGDCELYDITSKQKSCLLDIYPWNILGSKILPKYLISTKQEVFVADLDGQILEKVDFKDNNPYGPEIFWLRSNKYFVVLGQRLGEVPKMMFYDGTTHKRLQTTELKPNEIVPYEKYQTKAMAPLHWCRGGYLDHWFGVRFDEDNNILRLHICRAVEFIDKKGLAADLDKVKYKEFLVEIKINEEKN